ncbi:MAG TPA: hypothetical protein VGW38_05535 [Chloroflexota bacterium]|nr:hypothetical protein [Chloroflexota bacterium]
MLQPSPLYHCHPFPSELISHAMWLYCHFLLSYRDSVELLAECGIAFGYETSWRWCHQFGHEQGLLSGGN